MSKPLIGLNVIWKHSCSFSLKFNIKDLFGSNSGLLYWHRLAHTSCVKKIPEFWPLTLIAKMKTLSHICHGVPSWNAKRRLSCNDLPGRSVYSKMAQSKLFWKHLEVFLLQYINTPLYNSWTVLHYPKFSWS